MTLNSQEHIDVMNDFERLHLKSKAKPAREDKSLWPKGIFYCNGETNIRFLAYRDGYALAKCVYLQRASVA